MTVTQKNSRTLPGDLIRQRCFSGVGRLFLFSRLTIINNFVISILQHSFSGYFFSQSSQIFLFRTEYYNTRRDLYPCVILCSCGANIMSVHSVKNLFGSKTVPLILLSRHYQSESQSILSESHESSESQKLSSSLLSSSLLS